MYWGEPCWQFFHVMAETVREDRFAVARSDILQIIAMMCSNLPCPDCAAHATQYLAAHQGLRGANTKDALRLALCAFHNSVNQRKGRLPLFDPADLAATYGRANVTDVAARALFFFQSRHSAPPGVLVPNTLSRDRTAAMVRAWITANADKFCVAAAIAPVVVADAAAAAAPK
jgi:hypothetical protein